MIFVTVGTQLPFDRLIRGMDLWAETNKKPEVIAQTGKLGPQNYVPRHMVHMPALNPDDFDTYCQDADLIVAHAGTGSLLKAQACKTPLLMMPRRADMGEHRNDHQSAMAKGLQDRPGVQLVFEEDALPQAVDTLLASPPLPPALREHADAPLISALRAVIFRTD